jgi:hypothetical protein
MNPEQIVDELRAVNTRDEARQIVATVKGAALKELANLLEVAPYGTVAQLRERVVDATAGTREDAAAIRSRAWR